MEPTIFLKQKRQTQNEVVEKLTMQNDVDKGANKNEFARQSHKESIESINIQRHNEAMKKISKYPTLMKHSNNLFHVIDTFKNSRKYAKIMAMFDNLILDLWNFYKGDGTVTGPRWNSWDEEFEQTGHHEINCTNIHKIHITQRVGGGYIKDAYEGDFNGKKVVVKVKNMKNSNFPDACGWDSFTCAVYRDVRILNELVLLDHVDHPMFIRVLGYCIHNGIGTARFLHEQPGVVGVYEYGRKMNHTALTNQNWPERINLAMEIADFLIYVEHSPFGPLTLYDLEVHQFIQARGHICLTDLDVAGNMDDPMCKDVTTHQKVLNNGTDMDVCYFKYPFNLGYEFDIPCVEGRCFHLAQRHNMMKMHNGFLRFLLFWKAYPKQLHHDVVDIVRQLDEYMPAIVLYEKLKTLRGFTENWTATITGNV